MRSFLKELTALSFLICLSLNSILAQEIEPPPPPPPAPLEEAVEPAPPAPPAPPRTEEIKIEIDSEEGEDVDVDVEETETETRVKVGGVEVIIRDKADNDENEDEKEWEESAPDFDKAVPKELKKVKTRWGLLEVGHNTFLQDGSFDLTGGAEILDTRGNSFNWNLHIVQQRVSLIKNAVNLQYGVSVFFNKYCFKEDFTLDNESTHFQINPNPSEDLGIGMNKNRLRTTTFAVPLMLNFETRPRKPGRSLHLSAGAYAGVMTNAKLKHKYDNGSKQKISDDFGLNKLHYGLMGQIGVGPITFYGKYSMTPLYSDSTLPEVNPISIGVVLVPF